MPEEALVPTEAPAPPPTLRRLFLGDDGLRAGWSFALFMALFIALTIGLFSIAVRVHMLHLTKPVAGQAAQLLHPRTQFTSEALQILGVLLAAFIMSRFEGPNFTRRSFAHYGFALRRAMPDFVIGLFWGFAALSALIGTLFLTHAIAFDGRILSGTTAWLYAAKWGAVFLCVGILEEFVTRGYLQYTLARGVAGIARAMNPARTHTNALSFWIAAFLLSVLLFMMLHLGNPGETVVGILAVGAAGATFAFAVWRTGTLWWAIGFHAAWDWAQSYFYGTADSGTLCQGHLYATHPIGRAFLSGAADGPEGSIFVLPTLALVCLIIHVTLPYRDRP